MNAKIILELFLSTIDIGAVYEALNKYRKRDLQVDLIEITKYLLWGKGYENLTPPRATRLIMENKHIFLIVDLRETIAYEKNHIPESKSMPFDDFLKDIYEGMFSAPIINQKTLLVCDTGQLSKVAAAVMIENGFTGVYSLNGGMRRWDRWMRLSGKAFANKTVSCGTHCS